MKLLIAGSRSITDIDLSKYVPENIDEIISGGARGVDTVAEEFAKSRGIPITVILPQYNLYGRVAPIKRDDQMVDMADAVLVIWDGVSRGSKHTMDYAKKKNKPVVVVNMSENGALSGAFEGD